MLTFETHYVKLGLLFGVSDLLQVGVGGVDPDSMWVVVLGGGEGGT